MKETTREERREGALEKLGDLNAQQILDWEAANGAMGGISQTGKTIFANALASDVRRMADARDWSGLYTVATGLELVREACGLSISEVAALAPGKAVEEAAR